MVTMVFCTTTLFLIFTGLALYQFGDLRGLMKQQYVGNLGANVVGGGSAGGFVTCMGMFFQDLLSGLFISNILLLGNYTVSGGNVTATNADSLLLGNSLSGAPSVVGYSVAFLNGPCGVPDSEIFAFGVIGVAQVTGDTNGASAAPGWPRGVCVFEGTTNSTEQKNSRFCRNLCLQSYTQSVYTWIWFSNS